MPENKSDACFLAIDIGAGSGRAVLGRFKDERLEMEEAHRFPNGGAEIRGTLCWDAPRLYAEVVEGIKRGAAVAGGRLAGVGVDTWGVDFGLLGEHGQLLANPVHYRDARTDGIMERVFEVVPREKIFETTGIQFLQFNTLFQLVAMRLLKSPELDSARTLLMMPDLMNYFLCGKKVSEFTIATTTQFYDPVKKDWARDLLAALGLPAAILPGIVAPGTVLGPLAGEAARAAGDAPVIAPACHDTGSAVAAVPVDPSLKPGEWAYLSSGTWSLMGIEVREPIINERSLARNFTNEGGVDGTFRFLKNISGLWLIEECRRAWREAGESDPDYGEMESWALSAAPFRAFIDPDHPGFLRPANMPGAIAEFCRATGQPAPAGKGEFIRCILESLALKYRLTRDRIEDISGRKIRVLHVVGGGSRNHLLNRFTADALEIPVLAGPAEATSIGNLVIQAIASRVIPDLASARALIRNSFPLKTHEPAGRQKWDEAMERFLAVKKMV
ncbi:MAG TPA: rhamnulokinase family protein [bacterium]|nr:rhamnulokinase family protein [bacterium]